MANAFYGNGFDGLLLNVALNTFISGENWLEDRIRK